MRLFLTREEKSTTDVSLNLAEEDGSAGRASAVDVPAQPGGIGTSRGELDGAGRGAEVKMCSGMVSGSWSAWSALTPQSAGGGRPARASRRSPDQKPGTTAARGGWRLVRVGRGGLALMAEKRRWWRRSPRRRRGREDGGVGRGGLHGVIRWAWPMLARPRWACGTEETSDEREAGKSDGRKRNKFSLFK